MLHLFFQEYIYQIGNLMLKVAVLDDYQNVFSQIVNINDFKSKYEFTIFNEPFQNELPKISAKKRKWRTTSF